MFFKLTQKFSVYMPWYSFISFDPEIPLPETTLGKQSEMQPKNALHGESLKQYL